SQRTWGGADLSECSRIQRLWQEVPRARQWNAARRLLQRHQFPAGLVRTTEWIGSEGRGGDGGELRWVHDARGRHQLQRPHLLLGGHRGPIEPGDVSRAYVRLP